MMLQTAMVFIFFPFKITNSLKRSLIMQTNYKAKQLKLPTINLLNQQLHQNMSLSSQRKQLNQNQIKEFKLYLSEQLSGPRKKLIGNQIINLKQTHFNEYIKKIKYYAKKDLQKITEFNKNKFYQNRATESFKNYQQRETPTNIIKKQKPLKNSSNYQKSVYYYGEAELSSMKQFIFLVEQCKKMQEKIQKVIQKRKNQAFIKNIEQRVQSPERHSPGNFKSSKSLNLHLTVKSAKMIDSRMKQKLSLQKLSTFHSTQLASFKSRKSMSVTNFKWNKSSSQPSTAIITSRKSIFC